MERFQRIARIWNWLPAFRAVAETEHVRKAAELMCVSPSALSRTIGLLEHDVGGALFSRAGRSLRLTPLGQELLTAVRDSMRGLDDLLLHTGLASPRVLAIAAPDVVSARWLAPAIAELARRAAGAIRVTPACRPDEALTELLCRGELDLAFTWSAEPCVGINAEHLGDVPRVVCRAARGADSRISAIGGSIPPGTPVVVVAADPIPVELGGPPCLVVNDCGSAIAACAAGTYVAVLPRQLADRELEVLAINIAPAPLFARWRTPLDATTELVQHIGSLIEGVRGRLARDAGRLPDPHDPPSRGRPRPPLAPSLGATRA
jgi:DNA-binding transcriptional LysR family regulator